MILRQNDSNRKMIIINSKMHTFEMKFAFHAKTTTFYSSSSFSISITFVYHSVSDRIQRFMRCQLIRIHVKIYVQGEKTHNNIVSNDHATQHTFQINHIFFHHSQILIYSSCGRCACIALSVSHWWIRELIHIGFSFIEYSRFFWWNSTHFHIFKIVSFLDGLFNTLNSLTSMNFRWFYTDSSRTSSKNNNENCPFFCFL